MPLMRWDPFTALARLDEEFAEAPDEPGFKRRPDG